MPLQQSEVKNLKFVDYHICDENLPNFKDKFKQYQRLLNFEILSSKISSALLRISQRTTYLRDAFKKTSRKWLTVAIFRKWQCGIMD